MTISTCYSPRLLDATSRLQSFQFWYQSSLPRWLRTSLDEHPSTPFLLSPTLVNTSASALEAREKFRRSLVCRAVALAEARHGSSRIRWKFHPVRRFKSQNCKFVNPTKSWIHSSWSLSFEIQTMSRDKFSLFVCLFVTEQIHSIFTGSLLCAVTLIYEVFFFFCEINPRSFNLEVWKVFLFFNIDQSIQITKLKKHDYLCHLFFYNL